MLIFNRKHKNSSALYWVIAIVIVCVILAIGMMIPCCPEPPGTHEAYRIVAGLQKLKNAALIFYADNIESFDKDGRTIEDFASNPENISVITKYMDDNSGEYAVILKGADAKAGEYMLASGRKNGGLFAGYRICDKKQSVKDKLAGKAETLGLLSEAETDSPRYTSLGENTSWVWLRIL